MEPELACRRHPNHKRLQGVCPFCLRERLSQLAAAAASQVSPPPPASSHSSSLANYFSPASTSNNTSPPRGHNRNISEIAGSISFMLSVGSSSSGGLKKSRSIAFVPRNFVGELQTGQKKKGFWSKLLHRERKKDVFMHC